MSEDDLSEVNSQDDYDPNDDSGTDDSAPIRKKRAPGFDPSIYHSMDQVDEEDELNASEYEIDTQIGGPPDTATCLGDTRPSV